MIITFALSHQIISRTDNMILASGSKNYVTAKFELLTEDWTTPITAIFDSYTVILDEDNQCLVPWEVLANPGKVAVSAFCGDLHTATSVLVPVHPSGYVAGETPQPPTPDVYQQLIDIAKNAEDVANSVREDADAGKFNGAIGPVGHEGPQGQDAPQIDDTQASPEHPWSGAKVATELGKYAPLESAMTVSGIGSDMASLSPTIAWKMQGLKLFGRTTQDGTPTPDAPVPMISAGEGGSVEVTVLDGDENSQSVTVTTPNGLPGIQVDSNGNFIDENGQQWICDEVDFARGKYIKRIGNYTFSGNETFSSYDSGVRTGLQFGINGIPPCKVYKLNTAANQSVIMCNVATASTQSTCVGANIAVSKFNDVYFLYFASSVYGDKTVIAQRMKGAIEAGSPWKFIYELETPQEIDLPKDVLAKYAALTSYNGTTNVIAQSCGVDAKALANPDEYIKGLIQRIAALEQNAIGG